MIRMDHIDLSRCAELWQDSPSCSRMMINGPWKIGPPIPEEQEEEVETSTPERTDIDWTAHVTHADPQRWDKHDLTKPVLLVSAGLLNFEDSSYSNGESHDFIEWYRHQFGGHKPYSGFLTNHRQGAGIAKNSFRTCFPELCAGRQVIFLDCALVAADPGDDRSLRGHTGRHWRNVGNFVNHPSFIGFNDDLKEAEGDKPFLVVDFCNQGRHRSVANKEVLHDLFKRNWFGSKRGQVGMIDLQVRHWHKLCAPDCPDCDCKSQEFKDAVERGISRISDFLPTRKKANPCWLDGVHRASCTTYHVSRITYHVSRITYHISRIMYYVSCIMCHVSCIMYHVLCIMVSCTHCVSCIM